MTSTSFLHFQGLRSRDIDGVIGEVLDLVQRNVDECIFYFDGWDGYGATALLSYMARILPTMKDPRPGLCFGRIIYLDCSMWESKRAMQRKLAEELKLDRKTIAMFDEQDEDDNFYGVDRASRDVIRNVAAEIDRTMRKTRFMVIFINGSGDDVILSRFGIPEYHDHVIIWTFRRCRMLDSGHVRHTDIALHSLWSLSDLTSPQLSALLHEEAVALTCLQDIDPAMVIDCFFYRSFLNRSHGINITYKFLRREHYPSSYWTCSGVIQRDRARKISNALLPKIGTHDDGDIILHYLSSKTSCPYLIVEDDELLDAYEKRPYRWIAIKLEKNNTISKNYKVQEDLQTTLAMASSIILGSIWSRIIEVFLPNHLFKQCNNLCMLILSSCSFSFVSPPFFHCQTLRYLVLAWCTDDGTTQLEGENRIAKWACLQSLLVLDLYFTEWSEILTEEKIDLMTNLTELNIEGGWCWQYISKIEQRLPNLIKLRIIKPAYRLQAETLTDISNSMIDKTKMEVLDLSGNKRMKNLPVSLFNAGRLQELVLDGCVGLEEVQLANSSLKSFSFTNRYLGDRRPEAITSKISLKGCIQLEKLMLHGQSWIAEKDLSGCAIKVLDLGAMGLIRLKRIFLLGCENLCVIKQGPRDLELVYIDTRPGSWSVVQPYLAQACVPPRMQIHAIIVDARLVRSLCNLIHGQSFSYFSINITSSTACSWALQPEATRKELTESKQDQQHYIVPSLYGDVFSEVGDAPIPKQAFPQPPSLQLGRHIEIGDGSRNVQSELLKASTSNLRSLMIEHTETLHVHDVLDRVAVPAGYWRSLWWCRVERCPNLEVVFPSGADEVLLQTIWVSDLLKARCIWSKSRYVVREWRPRGWRPTRSFASLQHLHLRSCPSIQYALPLWFDYSFPNLVALYIIHCGSLRHVFEQDEAEEHQSSVQFPKLTTICLHDLPALQQICEDAETLAPALETIKIRGCWSLRRLPALKGRELDMKKPTVEVEKDVWDALEWDGVDAGHHPYLYETPVHSHYYRQSRLLRGTVKPFGALHLLLLLTRSVADQFVASAGPGAGRTGRPPRAPKS
ncbi:unnamed protein product [Urochloa decumbens]|uniref:Disease resistance protein At4g27190-like leucine-rich repeats domain-containing protein n=1 Tax=Urochloa decumbens TaxID=240449 RepID=A0ABC9BX72_9POAL